MWEEEGKGTQFMAGKKCTREQNRGPRANWMSQCTSQTLV